jgi:hypothetical protein
VAEELILLDDPGEPEPLELLERPGPALEDAVPPEVEVPDGGELDVTVALVVDWGKTRSISAKAKFRAGM